MTDLVQAFNRLMGETSNIEEVGTLGELKELFEQVAGEADTLQGRAEDKLSSLQVEKEELKSSMGLRDKMFGGRLGGDRQKSSDSKELTLEIESVTGLVTNITAFQETFNESIMKQAVNLIAADDEDFAQTVEYQSMMTQAVEYTEEVLREIDEALDALDNAESSEEWDMMTDSAWADMESDQANAEAADEVADVTNILLGYRTFLSSMGESAQGLHEVDFDFTWGDMMNENFFGDFWGGSDMLNKIARGQDQMADLRDKIVQLFESFAADGDKAYDEIQARINEEWDNV